METIENTLDLLAPDLTNVNLFIEANNRDGGLRVRFYTDANVHFTQAVVQIEKNSSTVCSVTTSSSVVFIPASDLVGVVDADIITIKVSLYSGLSSKETSMNHVYYLTPLPLESRVNEIEQQLTLGNIIDSFAQDNDALQALANVLHSSNTLAQKVSELIAP